MLWPLLESELNWKRNETKQKRHTHLLPLLWKCHSMEIDRSLIANRVFQIKSFQPDKRTL